MSVVWFYVFVACLSWGVLTGIVWLANDGELPAWFVWISMLAVVIGLFMLAPVVLRAE